MQLINQVKEMQMQGLNEMEMQQKMLEQGVSPLEINQALEQAKIKSAVSEESQEFSTMAEEEMQPGIIEEQPIPASPAYEQQENNYPPSQQYAPAYEEYSPYQSASSETMAEIAEQIAEERIQALKKNLDSMQEFKITAGKKIESMDERLKKIESMIEILQKAIISKIGAYGDNLDEIKNEMSMMQDSFSKALNPLIDKSRSRHRADRTEQKPEETEKQERKERKKPAIEHFLRR